jgi:AraC-like DNA-binding protein
MDRVLREAVELLRAVIGLERAAIFLVDHANGAMLGTWGTDQRGETTDEHHIAYAFGPGDQVVFDRARNGMPWTVYEDCPLVSQLQHETRVFGTGWIACIAIQGARRPHGILFNDAGLTRAPFYPEKQALATVVCALLGQALDRCRTRPATKRGRRAKSEHPLVRQVTNLLVGDPSLTCDQLAERVHVSAGRLARTFKRETHTSVVAHRNELRLARFLDRVAAERGNLLEAALEAGFGSYAQFHRVFRARFGRAPRVYLGDQK